MRRTSYDDDDDDGGDDDEDDDDDNDDDNDDNYNINSQANDAADVLSIRLFRSMAPVGQTGLFAPSVRPSVPPSSALSTLTSS